MTHRAVVVMGVSGSGKTTVAKALAERLGWQFADGDEFHPADNVAKMRAGIPLTDGDRASWLAALREWITVAGGDVVVACSALKRSYRDTLRGAQEDVSIVQLDGDRDVIMGRMNARQDHFMPAGLLDSQLATLEPLQSDEHGTIIDIDTVPENIVQQAIHRLDLPAASNRHAE